MLVADKNRNGLSFSASSYSSFTIFPMWALNSLNSSSEMSLWSYKQSNVISEMTSQGYYKHRNWPEQMSATAATQQSVMRDTENPSNESGRKGRLDNYWDSNWNHIHETNPSIVFIWAWNEWVSMNQANIRIEDQVESYDSNLDAKHLVEDFFVEDKDNSKLVLLASWEQGNPSISATWNGNQTFVTAVNSQGGRNSAILYLDNPVSGTHDIEVTFGGNTGSRVGVVSLSGAAGGVAATFISTGETGQVSTVSEDSLLFGTFTTNGNSGILEGPPGFTEIYNGASHSSRGIAVVQRKLKQGSLHTLTWSGDNLSGHNNVVASFSGAGQGRFTDLFGVNYSADLEPQLVKQNGLQKIDQTYYDKLVDSVWAFKRNTPNFILRDSSSGKWYFKQYREEKPGSNSKLSRNFTGEFNWASGSHYQPFVGDFNGDGLIDVGLRNTSNGTWYFAFRNAGSFSFSNTSNFNWASGSHYQPFVGDFIMMGGQISALEIQAMGPGISHSVDPLLFGLTILKTLIG